MRYGAALVLQVVDVQLAQVVADDRDRALEVILVTQPVNEFPAVSRRRFELGSAVLAKSLDYDDPQIAEVRDFPLSFTGVLGKENRQVGGGSLSVYLLWLRSAK